jgi:hypothetical protein
MAAAVSVLVVCANHASRLSMVATQPVLWKGSALDADYPTNAPNLPNGELDCAIGTICIVELLQRAEISTRCWREARVPVRTCILSTKLSELLFG